MKKPKSKIKSKRLSKKNIYVVSAAFRAKEFMVLRELSKKSGASPSTVIRGLVRQALSYGAGDIEDVTHGELLEIIRLGKL